MINIEQQDVMLSDAYNIRFVNESSPDVVLCTLSGQGLLDISKLKEITRALELALKCDLVVKISYMEMEVW